MMPSPQASFRAVLLAGTALLALPQAAGAQPAPNARPIGGAVVAGSAAISRSSSATTITQASQRAAINWQSFNVGAQQSVNFQQPNASAVALNRVIGPNPSQIAGRIDANGQVILINQDGITFYRGAQVNAAGFVASAAGMADQDFMAGRMAFTQPAHPGAAVVNAGTITVKQAGLAAFVAPQVANSGVITAKFGHVVLAGARTATLDLYGDGLVALDVTNQVTQTPGGATALVTNSGTILAQGGTVQLTARAADGLVQELVDAGGHISASASGAPGGTIVLDGIGGDIQVTGQLTATGTQGGQIAVLPSGTATLAATARLDASGTQRGGVVAVGTTLARASGGPSVAGAARSAATVVQAGARIAANATRAGDGGHVAVLSSGLTVMDGTISARGGAQGGNGGTVEASGNDLGFAGTIDVGAPAGTPGSVLFDPATLDIGTGTSPTITNPGSVSYLLDPTGTDTVDATALGNLTGNITLQAGTLLEVQQPVAFTKSVNVTLQSGGNLLVDAGVTLSAAAAASTLTLDAGETLSGSVGGTGGLAMAAGASIGGWSGLVLESHGGGIDLDGATLGASTLTVAAAGGGVLFGAAQITGVTLLDVSAQGDVTQSAAGTIAATTLQSGSGITGNLLLTSGNNAIGTLSAITAGGNITLDDTHDLTVAGALLAGDGSLTAAAFLDLTTTGALTLAAGVTSTVMSLNAASIAQTGGIIAAVSLDAAASAGGITLANTSNFIGEIGNVTATGGDVVLADTLNVTLDGTVGGNDIFIDAALAGGTLSIGIPAVTGPPATAAIPATLTLNAAGGRISLVADNLTEATGSALNSAGTVEIAPFSTSVAEVLGAAGGAGTLGVATTLLGEIGSASALVIGRVTPAGGLSGQTADGITIAGAVDLTGIATALDLASTNGLSEAGTGTLTVGTLESSTGITGAISLAGSHNAIGTLGSFDAAGDIVTLVDTGSLTLAGPLSATAATFNVATLSEATGALVSLGTLAGSGTSFALAAAGNTIGTLGAVTLSGNLTLAESGALSVAGPVNAADATLSAGTLLLAGRLDVTTGTLALGSTGTVSESGATITAGTLAGSGTVGAGTIGGDLALGGTGASTNDITVLSNVTVGGNLTLVDAHSLSVRGAVSAANAALSAPTLAFAGSLDVGAGTLALGSSGTISETGASLTAGTLAGFGTIAGDLLLDGTGTSTNDIAALGSLKVGGNLTLADASALTVAGAVSAGSAKTLLLQAAGAGNGIAVGIAGTPGTAGSLTGGTVSLAAAGAITEPDGTIAATTLSASAAGGAVALGNTGNTIAVADGITATGGDLVLASASSMTLQDTLTGNDLTVTVAATSGTLNLGTALLSANAAGRISLVADTLTEHSGTGASLTAAGGAVELAPFSTSEAYSLDTSGGTLSLNGAKLPSFTADTLTIGGITGTRLAASVTITAGIDLTGNVDTLDLLSRGAITDTKSLTVGTLLANAGGSIAIDSTLNTINVLGSVTATSLTLGDSAPLTLDGPLSVTTATFDVPTLSEATGATVSLGTLAGSGTLFDLTSSQNSIATLGSVTLSGDLTLAEGGSLSIAGPVSAADATLSAGTLLLAGSLDVGTGTLALGSAGTVSETGATIIAGTVSGFGTIGGDLLLGGGSNSIATLGSLTVVGDLTLADAHELSVSGPVGATNATLSAPTLKLAGSLDVGAGTLALGSAGTISESGATLIAGTLAGFGTIGGDLALADAASSNSIATLGSLTVGGNVTLADAQNLTLDGPLHVSAATFDAATLSEAAGALVSLGTLAGSGTTFALASAGNSIATLGAVTLGGDLTLAESGALSVAGPVSAADATLSAGTLAFVGSLSVGTGTLALGSTGTVSESGATITAGTLAGSGTVGAGTIGGDLALGGTGASTNDITVLSNVTVGGNLTLVDAHSLSVSGAVSAANAALSAPTLAFAGSLDVGTGTLALGSSGTISETGASLTAGTLAGFGTIAGDLLLDGTGTSTNDIATLGSLSVGGNLTLADASALTVAGAVSAGSAKTLLLQAAGAGNGIAVGIAGTPGTAGSLTGGTVSLAAAGAITEPDGTIAATTLSASAAGGAVALGNTGNTIAVADGITATGGDLVLASASSMLLAGTLAGNDLTVTVAATHGELDLGSASLSAATAGRISLVADNFAAAVGASLEASGGAVELAPFSTGETFSLGMTGGTLALNGGALPSFTADTLTIGGITGTPLAASVTIAAAIDLTGSVGALDLLSLGAITDSEPLKVGTLLANGGTVAIGSTLNSINTLGSVTADSLTLGDALPLTLDGPVSATAATFDVPVLSEAADATLNLGTLAGNGVSFMLASTDNTIATLGSVSLDTLALTDGRPLSIAGPLTATTATFDVTTLNEVVGAAVSIGTLAGSGANFVLTSTGNSIATLGSVTLSGDLTLAESGALNIAGPVSAANASLSAGTLAFAGSLDVGTGTLALGSAGTISESGATLIAGTLAGFGTIGGDLALADAASSNSIATLGSLTVGGNVTLADAQNLTLDGPLHVSAATFDAATLSEAAGAVVSLGTLAGSGTTFALASAGNSIATLGAVTLGGDLTLTESGALSVAGPVNAADATLSAGTLAFVGSLSVGTGTLALGSTGTVSESGATITAGTLAGSGTVGAGTIGGDLALGGGSNSIATIGSLTVGSNVTLADAQPLTLDGPVSATAATFDVPVLSEAADADVSLGTLAGNGVSFMLASTDNTIATLGSVSLDTLALTDGRPLSIAGPLTATTATFDVTTLNEVVGAAVSIGTLAGSGANFVLTSTGNSIATLGSVTLSGDLTLAESGALNIAGPVSAANASLSAGTLAFAGSLDVGTGTLALGSAGTISESGATLIAGTLAGFGTIGGDLALADAASSNSIATLGSLTVGGNVTLADAQNLTLDGPLHVSAATFDAATLSEAAGAVVSLGTLAGSGTTFALASAGNSIATLGAVTLGGDLTLTESGALSVAGPVNAADATLSAGTLAFVGSLSVGTGTLALGSTGTVSESGATITAGTLAGSGTVGAGTIGGDLALGGGSNSIATIGSLTVGSNVTLADAQPLTLDGPVSATAATFDVPVLSEAADADVSLGTLAGSGVSFMLVAARNSIATLGSVTLSGDLTLAEVGALSIAGPVSAADATLSAGSLVFAGSLDVGTGTLALASTGTVSETGATITAGTLAGFGTIGGDLLLGGGSNSIATLGSLTVGGNLTLADAHALSVSGPVAAADAALSAPTLTLAGSLDVGAGTLALGSSGTVGETGATLIAGTLAGFGTIGGDLAFGGGSNSIATLGSLTVGGNVTLADTQPLTLAGPFSASRATLDNIASLHETGGATVSLGTLAGGGDGNFHLSAGHNSIAAIGSLALGGNLTLADTAPLSVDGPLTAASASLSAPSITLAGDVGTGTLALGSTGTVSQTGGVITAGQLTGDGTIGGDLSLAVATNSITSVGSVAVGGNATLADGVPLTIDGPFVATNATLGAPTLTLAGLVSLATGGLLELADAGRVLETAAATLVAGTLAGTAAALDFSAGSNTLASIGNLGVTGTMTLVDTGSLAIAGAVTASAATIDAATLGIAGSVVAPSVVLTGGAGGIALGSAARVDGAGIALASVGPISFAGNAVLGDAAAAVALDVTGAGISEAPSSRILAASLLVPGVAGTADLAGTANAIATLSGFSATGDLVLEDGAAAALTLSGTVAAAGNVSIGDVAPPGLLTLAGTLTGTSVALASGSGGITLGGPIGATTLALAAAGGGVQESGSPALNLGMLTSHGTIVGNVALGGAANSIGMLGLLLASGGVTLADAAALDIAGPVEAASVTVTSPAALTLAGTLAASLVTLDAGGITLAAGALLEQANTVDLSSSAGISEAAAAEIATTTLFSSQGVTGAATLAGTANAVATLDGFSVQGGPFSLVDAAPLLIAGPVAVAGSAGTILAVTDPDGITVGGSIGASGGAVSLAAGAPGLTLAGAAQIAGGASVTLVSAGSIALAGGADILTPATLDVSAAGALTEAAGARITAATLDSAGGLQDGASLGGTANSVATLGSMTVAGALALTDATALGVTGPIVAGSATIVTPAALSITGSLAATQATLTAGSIGLASGAVLGENGATLDLTTTAGGVAEAAGAQLLGAQLGSSGNIATNALLLGSANAITALGPFAAGGTLEFIDAALLAVGGPVSATDVVLADAVGMAVGGPVTAAAALAVSTGAAGLLVAGGGVLAAPAIAAAGSGPISLAAGAVLGEPGAAIDLATSAGGVAEAAGATITAASLTSNSGIAGNASFLGTANTVATLADMTATGTLALTDSTALALAGTIAAPLLLLATPGDVTEAGGAVLALQTLGSTGTIGGSVLLQSGVNAIGTLGGFAAAGALALTDNVPLTVAGPASAADIALTVPSLDVTGTLAAATVLTLTAPAMTFAAGASISAPSVTLADGGIIEDTAAVLAAQTLTSLGIITGTVALVGTANVVSRLADFTDADSLTLTDDTALTLAGLIAAPRIVIDTEGHPLTLAPGATIETGGQAAPTGAAFSDVVVPAASLGDAGAYLTVGSFTQTGSSYVAALGGSSSVLRIDAINAGSISFDPVFGLYGQSTWLILGLTSGPGGTGSRATGNVFLKALTVVYPPGGGGVSAGLFGTINEIGGQAAAGSGDVTPQPDTTVRLNNCALHSVDCVLLPVQGIPVANPLQNFDIGSMFNQNDDDDLLLPIVSDNDY